MKKLFYLSIIAVFLTAAFLSPCFGQKVDVEAKTKTYGGENGGEVPGENVAAMWIQTPQEVFIQPLMVWSSTGFDFMLKNFRTVTEILADSLYDGVTSATRKHHDDPLIASWDCKDTSGALVPAGTYEYWVEMTESDFWWQDGEEYFGKVTKGSIEIDYENAFSDTGSAIENIFDIYASFDPTTEITFKASEKQSNALSFTYNPLSHRLMIELGTLSSHSGMVRIYNLRGAVLKTISFAPNTKTIHWDGKNAAGYPMPSGVYMFEIQTNDTQIKSSVYSATLFK